MSVTEVNVVGTIVTETAEIPMNAGIQTEKIVTATGIITGPGMTEMITVVILPWFRLIGRSVLKILTMSVNAMSAKLVNLN